MNLYLIGYRCTGKTSVGKKVAESLGMTFVDADDYLVQKEGRSIKEIFADKGEAYFRDIESQCLKELSRQVNVVVGTGGGVVLRQDNIDQMQSTGPIILLKAKAETIFQRMEKDDRSFEMRPSLTNQSALDEIVQLLNQRTPLYDSAADICFDTTNISVDEISQQIIDYLKTKDLQT